MSEEDGFWLQLVSECQDMSKLPQGRRLLVLGDDDAEKATLVDRLDDSRTPSRRGIGGNGLEYRHLSVRDEYRENQARLGVWLLDGDPFYRPLLRYALDAASLPDTTALVVASMSRPWDILDAVRSWTQILRDHIQGLVPPEELERRKKFVLERYREYVEPGLSLYGSLAADNTREIEENLGLELVVVVTRTDEMCDLHSECGYEEEHFDFIQLALRDFCLRHGAALFYVSVREDKNCDLLLKYLLHRTHAFPFRLPGVLVERDAILVPAGWDNRNKVRFLADTLSTIPPDTPYRDVVFRPARMIDSRRVAPEVFAQGDQEFLADLQSALERPSAEMAEAAAARDCSSMNTTTVVQRNVARRMARGAPRSPQKKRAVEGGDTTLSNFFHSLLNRRTSTPSDRPLGMSGARTYAPKEQTTAGLAESDEQINHNVGKSNGQSNFANSVHLSLDQGAHQQLPEYFLSNPVCSHDCSFRTEPSSSSLDLEDEFIPPLDRVRSSFNPPLRTRLERPDKLLTNGQMTRSEELTNGEATTSKERPDEEWTVENNGEAGRNTEQTDGESQSRDVCQKVDADGQLRLTNGKTKIQNSGSDEHSGDLVSKDEPETVMTLMPLRVGGTDVNSARKK